jgi:hypothetical protein
MAEYIEREALKNEIATSTEPFNTGSVFRAINRQAAADVALVVHGEWIHHEDGVVTCSECGNAESSDSYYCRYCGAKMDGGADHEDD